MYFLFYKIFQTKNFSEVTFQAAVYFPLIFKISVPAGESPEEEVDVEDIFTLFLFSFVLSSLCTLNLSEPKLTALLFVLREPESTEHNSEQSLQSRMSSTKQTSLTVWPKLLD